MDYSRHVVPQDRETTQQKRRIQLNTWISFKKIFSLKAFLQLMLSTYKILNGGVILNWKSI